MTQKDIDNLLNSVNALMMENHKIAKKLKLFFNILTGGKTDDIYEANEYIKTHIPGEYSDFIDFLKDCLD